MTTEIAKRKSLTVAILQTGLIAGTLDITCAIIQYVIVTRNNPVRILYYIASAVFGKDAYDGGATMAITGLVFHYLVATIFAAFFFGVYPKLKFLSENIVLSGIGYGLFVWLIMNLVVVPFSKIGKFPSSPLNAVIGLFILIIAIGLPIAIMTYRYYVHTTTNE